MTELLVIFAGLGHFGIASASLGVPKVLGWAEDLRKLRPMNRQIFWVYASYIWGTNVAFGLLSLLAPATLLDRSTLAVAVSGFIALYWGARLLLQLGVLDRESAPKGPQYLVAEVALTTLFLFLTLVYSAAALA